MIQKSFKILIIAFLIFVIAFSTFAYAEPNTPIQPRTVENTEDEVDNDTSTIQPKASSQNVKNEDVYLSGTNVVLDQEVQGNVYIAGTKVTVTAPVYGNIFIVAPNIEFKSSDPTKPVYISGSAYLFGTNINLSLYCQDLYVLGSSELTISYDSCIIRDIRASVPVFNLYGIVRRNVFADSSSISLENSNNQQGVIEGDLNYYNTEKISISEDLVMGDVFYNLKVVDNTPSWASNLYVAISRFIVSVLFLLLLSRITPNIVHPDKEFVLKKFLGTCLYGIVTFITVPIICLLLIYCFPRLLIFALPIMFIYGAFIMIGFFTTMIYIVGLLEKAFKFKSLLISIGILFAINVILYIASFFTTLSLILTVLLVIPGFGLLSSKLLEKRTPDVSSK